MKTLNKITRNQLLVVLLVLVVGALGFVGGVQYDRHHLLRTYPGMMRRGMYGYGRRPGMMRRSNALPRPSSSASPSATPQTYQQ